MSPLEFQRIKKKYPCKEDEVYKTTDLIWQSCLENQTVFFGYSPIYTPEYIAQKRAEIVATQAMPNEDERSMVHRQNRVHLVHGGDECCVWWKYLEGHIIRTFPADEVEIILAGAGANHYKRATKHDWEFVTELMKAGNNVITENSAALLAAGMPADFQANYNAKWADFEGLYNEFKDSEQTAEQIRDAKIAANNTIYKDVMEMCKVGRKLFRYDAATRERFVFTKVLELVSGNTGGGTPAEASLKFKMNGDHINFGAMLLGILKILWGDNTSENFTGNPASVNFIDKIYAVAKLYSIVITGAIANIVELHISDSNLTYIKIHKSMKELKELILQNNQLTTKVVDDILVTINKFGTSGPDRVINLIGNEPPSAKGLAAKAELEARGWVVLTS